MKTTHGKPIDPREFKTHVLSNLESVVKRKREQAHAYTEDLHVQVTNCPICGNDKSKTNLEMHGVEWVQCTNCSHNYQPVMLDQTELAEFYESTSDYAETYTNEEQIAYRLENITKPKFDYILNEIDIDTGRWLDVGCGNGGSVHYLESLGWNVTGLEISADSVRTADEVFGIDLTQKTLMEYLSDNPQKKFDGISMLGYLDLVPDPLADLKRASKLLSDDGWIVIHGPHYPSITARVQSTFPDQAVRHLVWNVLHLWNEESVKQAFEEIGVLPHSMWYYGLDYYELITNMCLTINGFLNSDLYHFLMDNLYEFQKIIDEAELSDAFTVIGKKEPDYTT